MFNESISLRRLFQSLAAENWNVLRPAVDFALGRWSSVLSLKYLIRLLEQVGKYDTNGSGMQHYSRSWKLTENVKTSTIV